MLGKRQHQQPKLPVWLFYVCLWLVAAVAVCGCPWLSMVVVDCPWLSVAACGGLRLPAAVPGC
eukprot:6689345-Alexandrium_andersonii.AAC.1